MPARTPVAGKTKLWLAITVTNAKGKDVEQHYALRFLSPNREVADPAWRITRADGQSYDVALTEHGPHCTCPDFLYCREHQDPKACKHVCALRALGLLAPGVFGENRT
jgi:hypothetical protein